MVRQQVFNPYPIYDDNLNNHKVVLYDDSSNYKYPMLHKLCPNLYNWAWEERAEIDRQKILFHYFLQSRLLRKTFIHVLGDSHVGAFRSSKIFLVHFIGAATAYNLRQKKSSTHSNKKLFRIIKRIDKKRDTVILVFGEVDCRIHIYYQYRKNKGKYTIDQLIENTILSYGEVLKELSDMGINFFVYGVPPAAKQGNIYKCIFYAPPKKRSEISRKFNGRLKKYCQDKGYKYIDIYSKTCDAEGFIKRQYSVDDGVHLNGKAMKFVISDLSRNGVKI
jgi:hypothetical protein